MRVRVVGAGERAGDRIGPYKLLEVLGEGGFGVVYLAEQSEPVRRRVALKVVKPGMDSDAVLARFEQEKQALAVMDHPNVARVFDAGRTAPAEQGGRPYFAMEHVAGEPITTYCDRNKLSLRQRLELFIPVCEAVQHAHTKAIIHRDLKPANVLVEVVDGRPVPKVIDFGVAKALTARFADVTVYTQQGLVIGTPAYMAPEQARPGAVGGALDIDTRADVYSLGVMLYELLTGVLPFEREETLRAMSDPRAMTLAEPPRPSVRLSRLSAPGNAEAKRGGGTPRGTPPGAGVGVGMASEPPDSLDDIARRRRTDAAALTRTLRAELEWIPLKAMRTDREERYRSPADLASDIRNYLHDRPLVAGPESVGYRTRKFVRRHRLPVAASAVVLVSLVGFTAGLGVLLQRARAAEARTLTALRQVEAENAKFKAVNDFVRGIFNAADPGKDGTQVKVVDLLDRAATQADRGAESAPETAAALHETLGSTYQGLGLLRKAGPHYARALELRRATLGEGDPDTLLSMVNLATTLRAEQKFDEATAMALAGWEGLKRARGEGHRDTLIALALRAQIEQERGRLAEAEALFREVARLGEGVPADDDQAPMWYGSLGQLLQVKGDLAGAEPHVKRAVERALAAFGEDHPTTHMCMSALSQWHMARREFPQAEEWARRAYESGNRILPEDHPARIYWINNYARVFQEQGQPEKAEPLLRESVERAERVFGPEHADTLLLTSNWAQALQNLKRLDEAEALFRRCTEKARATLGSEHPNFLIFANNLANLLMVAGKPAEALPFAREVAETAARVLPAGSVNGALFSRNLGTCLGRLERFDEAEPHLLKAERELAAALPANHPGVVSSRTQLVTLYEKMNRPDDAAKFRALLPPAPAGTPPAGEPKR